ncbi:CDP-alcohol phosphatidyltransferase family protein [Pelagibacteraceae bacterium]|nr:CDP-alcohol phosphatidyltransferase family protein [Pelagibacteraceae bacterium]
MSLANEYKIPTRNNIVEDLYSKLAKLITPYFLKTSLTPNYITIISGIFGVVGSLMLISNQHFYLIISAILIQLYAILDLVDGDVARIKNLQSTFGMWLDIFFDKLIDFLLIFSLTLGIFFETNEVIYLIIGISLMGVVFFNQFIMVLNDTYFKISRDNNITIEYKETFSKSLFYVFIYKALTLFRTHLALQHNTFLLIVSIFALLDFLKIGIIFILFHGIVSLILSIIINFIKIR